MADRPATSRALPLLTALTCGVLLALALQVLLALQGLLVAEIWRDVIDGGSIHLRAAAVWWIIAGSTLVAGAVSARPLARFKPPWVRLRVLRWIAGAATVLVLAYIAHAAAPPEGITALVQLMASTTAVGVGAVMAALGALIALRT